MKVGILGGTFDPIHLGHLIIAEEARVRLGLEEVLFIPTGQPWMKGGQPISPSQHRMNMVRLAVASNPFFKVCSMEMERPGPSYTVETLEELRRHRGPGHEFFFILGLDSLKEFHRWKDPAGILERCTLVALRRPGYEKVALAHLEEVRPDALARVVFLDAPLIEISGTEIRRRVASGVSIRYWVPREVEEYIYHNGLYRNTEVHQ